VPHAPVQDTSEALQPETLARFEAFRAQKMPGMLRKNLEEELRDLSDPLTPQRVVEIVESMQATLLHRFHAGRQPNANSTNLDEPAGTLLVGEDVDSSIQTSLPPFSNPEGWFLGDLSNLDWDDMFDHKLQPPGAGDRDQDGVPWNLGPVEQLDTRGGLGLIESV
jgi:hypothetical protein